MVGRGKKPQKMSASYKRQDAARIGIWVPDASESYRLLFGVNLAKKRRRGEGKKRKKPAALGHGAVRHQNVRGLWYPALIDGFWVEWLCECVFSILLQFSVPRSLLASLTFGLTMKHCWIMNSLPLSDSSDLFSPSIFFSPSCYKLLRVLGMSGFLAFRF